MSAKLLPSFTLTGQLKNCLPTISAGLSLTIVVFVVLTSQVGLYFWKAPIHSRDPLWIKGIVILIWMIQVSDLALSSHITVITHCGDSALAMEPIKEGLWEWAMYIGTSVITECLVHAFFISRIYLLEINPAHKRISWMLCIILILEGCFGLISMLPFMMASFQGKEHIVLIWSIPIWLGFSILADISIAGSIYYILNCSGPVMSMRLSLLVKRLTKFCIQTGLITSLVSGITVALWSAAELDTSHLLMSFPMSGIYATCLMANLIARESYFHHIKIDEEVECLGMVTRSIVFAAPEGSEKNESITEVN